MKNKHVLLIVKRIFYNQQVNVLYDTSAYLKLNQKKPKVR